MVIDYPCYLSLSECYIKQRWWSHLPPSISSQSKRVYERKFKSQLRTATSKNRAHTLERSGVSPVLAFRPWRIFITQESFLINSPKQLVDAGIPYVILGNHSSYTRMFPPINIFLFFDHQVTPSVVHSSTKLQSW